MFKRIQAFLIAICCMLVAVFAVACGNKGGGDTGVAYTIVVQDTNENAVVGAELKIWQGETEIAAGTTNADGKMTGKVAAGDYVVQLVEVPIGYETETTEFSFALTKDNATLTLTLESSFGSAANPISFVHGDTGVMTYNIPAGTTYYFIVYRSQGGTMTFQGKNLQVFQEIASDDDSNHDIDMKNSLLIEEGETVSIILNGVLMDMHTATHFCIKNAASTPAVVTMTYIGLPTE